MNNDLRVSLKLWASAIAFVAIFWALLHSGLFQGLAGKVPSNWFWMVIGISAVWNLGQFGWGLWQRRASKVR
jgi:hypothetical protein